MILFSDQFCGISTKTHKDHFEFSKWYSRKTNGRYREASKFLIRKEEVLPDHYHRESTLYGKSELFCAEKKFKLTAGITVKLFKLRTLRGNEIIEEIGGV